MSLREFSRSMGVSDTAIRKAIRTGRISRGLAMFDGTPTIIDPVAAAEDWEAGRRQKALPLPSGPSRAMRTTPVVSSVNDVKLQIELEKLRKQRLENDRREHLLLPVADVERAQTAIAAAVRSEMLAVPRRCVLAGLPVEHEGLVKRLISEALRELSAARTMAALETAGGTAA